MKRAPAWRCLLALALLLPVPAASLTVIPGDITLEVSIDGGPWSNEAEYTINEGQTFQFRFRSSLPTPDITTVARVLTIHTVTTEYTRGTLSNEFSSTHETVPPGTLTLSAVQTEDDDTRQGDRAHVFEMYRLEGKDAGIYTRAPPLRKTIHIRDDESPRVWVTANSPTVTEGSSAELVAMLWPPADSALFFTVNLSVSSDFEIEGGLSRRAAFNAGETQAIPLLVPVVDNETDTRSGTLTAVAVSQGGYTARPQLTVTIEDNEYVEVSIAVSSSTNPTGEVTEGGTVEFVLTVSGELVESIAVEVALSVAGEFEVGETTHTVPFGGDQTTATLSVTIPDDQAPDDPGTLTATVRPGRQYVAASSGPAEVGIVPAAVILPEVWLEVAPGITYERRASLTFKEGTVGIIYIANTDHLSNVPVTVARIPDANAMLLGVTRTETSLTAGDTSSNYPVPDAYVVPDDGIRRPDGIVTLSIVPSPGNYWIGENGTVTLTITDNDGTTQSRDITVSLSSEASSVVEGNDAVFTLTADPVPDPALSVTVNLSLAGDYSVGGTTSPEPMTLSVDAAEKRFTVTVDGDETGELHGTLTAAVAPDPVFRLHAQDTVRMAIQDDDWPEMTIAVLASRVKEGRTAEFVLAASRARASASMVNVEVAVDGDFGVMATTTQVMFEANSRAARFTVDTVADGMVDEENGTLTVTVMPGADYNVGATSEATVTITDDVVPDINNDGRVNSNDALILYYAWVLRSSLGNGR